ncbi:MAG: YggS family pyridoxal phosphate-dependent enzyme [bacterium]
MSETTYSQKMLNSINHIKDSIESKGLRKPVELVAAAKFQSLEKIETAYRLGIRHFGENRGQEVRDKSDFYTGGDARLSYIGKLQKNKVKYLVGVCDLIQSIDSVKTAKYVSQRYSREDMNIDILMEINISGEESKIGIMPDKVRDTVKELQTFDSLTVRGIMTIGSLTDDMDIVRNDFRSMNQIFEELSGAFEDVSILSMGMTDDYEIALEEGSNMLRIGRLIFGERQ